MPLLSTLTPQHLCRAWGIHNAAHHQMSGPGHLAACSTDHIPAALQHLSAALRVLLAAAAGVSRPHTGTTPTQSPAPGEVKCHNHGITWSLLIPAHLDMARVDVTQPVSGVMADDAPGVARNSQLRVMETRLHVTPLPHQSAV